MRHHDDAIASCFHLFALSHRIASRSTLYCDVKKYHYDILRDDATDGTLRYVTVWYATLRSAYGKFSNLRPFFFTPSCQRLSVLPPVPGVCRRRSGILPNDAFRGCSNTHPDLDYCRRGRRACSSADGKQGRIIRRRARARSPVSIEHCSLGISRLVLSAHELCRMKGADVTLPAFLFIASSPRLASPLLLLHRLPRSTNPQVSSLQEHLVKGGTVSETLVIEGQPHHFVRRGGDQQVCRTSRFSSNDGSFVCIHSSVYNRARRRCVTTTYVRTYVCPYALNFESNLCM